MKPIFEPEELTLMTGDEDVFFKRYIKECVKYMDDKVDGIKMKQVTAQVANLTKVVQSRSATAMLKFNMINKDNPFLTAQMTGKKEVKKIA
jgi:hypothetical protein